MGVSSPSISTTSFVHKKSQPALGLLMAVYRGAALTAKRCQKPGVDALPRCHIDTRGIVSVAIGGQINTIDDADTDALVHRAARPTR